MMRRARDIAAARPEEVVFLDFGDKNFDDEVLLKPETPNRAFWHRVLNVALDDLASLIAPEIVVICEGTPLHPHAGANDALDAHCYDCIFEKEFPGAKFISAGNAYEVETDRLALIEAMKGLVTGVKLIRVIDRDDRSAAEIADKKRQGVRVLSKCNLESFLFDDEVLAALCAHIGKPEKTADLLAAKVAAIANSTARGNSPDDLKSAAGEIYNKSKELLQLVGAGSSAKAFMRATLAPRVLPSMAVYRALRRDIFE
jgi:hypothetical protein